MYKSSSVHRFRDFALKYEISVAKWCPSCFYCIVIKYFFYNYPEKWGNHKRTQFNACPQCPLCPLSIRERTLRTLRTSVNEYFLKFSDCRQTVPKGFKIEDFPRVLGRLGWVLKRKQEKNTATHQKPQNCGLRKICETFCLYEAFIFRNFAAKNKRSEREKTNHHYHHRPHRHDGIRAGTVMAAMQRELAGRDSHHASAMLGQQPPWGCKGECGVYARRR